MDLFHFQSPIMIQANELHPTFIQMIESCVLNNPHHCLRFSIVRFIFTFIGYAIKVLQINFTTTTNSHNTFEIVDLLIAKISLHTKRLTPWANLYCTTTPYYNQNNLLILGVMFHQLRLQIINYATKKKPLSFKRYYSICHLCIQ